MNRTTIILCILLVLVLTAYAVTPSNASLNGAYSFQFSGAHLRSWGQTLNCGGNNVFMGGTDTRDEVESGTATFDGNGNVTATFVDYGSFDQASSDASVSCASNGNPVYFPPTPGTATGTYSIQSTGDGTLTLTISGGGGSTGPVTSNIKVAGNCSTGLANTAFLVGLKSNNAADVWGVLRYQSTC